MVAVLKAIWDKVRSWLCRLHLVSAASSLSAGAAVLVLIAVVAAIWALLFAPDKIRQVALKVKSSAEFVAAVPAGEPADQQPGSTPRTGCRRTGTSATATGSTIRRKAPRPSRSRSSGSWRWSVPKSRSAIPDISGTKRSCAGSASSRARTSTLRKGGARQYGYLEGETIDPALKTERDVATGYPDNLHGLPVGFAKLTPRALPDQKPVELLGFTCAACHTGHIEYRNVSIRFDGGPAMANLGELERAIGLAIGYTVIFPIRFSYFASEVERLTNEKQDRTALKQATARRPRQDQEKEGNGGSDPPAAQGAARRRGLWQARRAQPHRQSGVLRQPAAARRQGESRSCPTRCWRRIMRASMRRSVFRRSGARRGSAGRNTTPRFRTSWCAMPAKRLA